MARARLIAKEKIDQLYNTVMDFPDYQMAGKTFSGKSINVGYVLDHIPNAATPIYMGTFGTEYLQPPFRTPEGLSRVRRILYGDEKNTGALRILEQGLMSIATESDPSRLPGLIARIPTEAAARKTFAAAFHVFNPDHSYGAFARAVLQKAADVMGLGDLSRQREKGF